MTETSGATTPTDIEMDTQGKRMRFVWADGRRSDFDWEYLRWRCPCATCSGEGEFAVELQSRTSFSAEELQMVDLELVGRYAVKPTWGNGHDTGLFTFRNLRQMAEQDGLLRDA